MWSIASKRSSQHLGRQAIVMGGSISGLLTARVLADFFDRVTIVERDEKPARPSDRKSVPQGRHVHVLLRRGSVILEELFPGIGRELKAHGAPELDLLNAVPFHLEGWHAACPGRELMGLFPSRALLEWQIDQRILAFANVRLREQAVVTDLLLSGDGQRISGVAIHDRRAARHEELAADLVVDATGRGSRLPGWLASLGFPQPQSSEVKLPVVYVSQRFRRPEQRHSWRGLIISPTPPLGRGGALFPVENDEWMVTLTGLKGDSAIPTDLRSFREFAAALKTPELSRAIADAEPSAAITSYAFPSNLWRHYERCVRFPSRLLAVGDAVCSLNPRFSQGMTVAALEALELQTLLQRASSRDLDQLGLRFSRRISRTVLDRVWPGVVVADLLYAGVTGHRSLQIRFQQWYYRRIFNRTHTDPALREAFVRISNFVDDRSRLYRPSVLARVLLRASRKPGHASRSLSLT